MKNNHPLLERLITEFQAEWVDEDNIETFLQKTGDQVLFFMGDAVRYPEGLDVAVVLPELQKHFKNCFGIGVVATAAEDALAKRFASRAWPSLVFLRDGKYVGNIPNMLDWDIYLEKVQAMLAAPTTRIPIPIATANNAATGCG